MNDGTLPSLDRCRKSLTDQVLLKKLQTFNATLRPEVIRHRHRGSVRSVPDGMKENGIEDWVSASSFTSVLACDRSTTVGYVNQLAHSHNRKNTRGHWEVQFGPFVKLLADKGCKWTLPSTVDELTKK